MFEHVLNLLKNRGQTTVSSPEDEQRLAAAVLLLEVARADYAHQSAEQAALRDALTRGFGLAADAVDQLLAQAEVRAKQSVSLFDFVQALNRSMTQERKRELLMLLWQVAHADGRVDPLEEHLLRRIADLLHLPHADFIRGKLSGNQVVNGR